MESRFSWPAAAAVAAILVGLPAKTSAEWTPIRPQDPRYGGSVVVDDTDPWRPDSGGPSRTVQGQGQALGPDSSPATAHVQPAARNESWVEWLLRALRFLFWGGEPR
jgi:hypothetical protein